LINGIGKGAHRTRGTLIVTGINIGTWIARGTYVTARRFSVNWIIALGTFLLPFHWTEEPIGAFQTMTNVAVFIGSRTSIRKVKTFGAFRAFVGVRLAGKTTIFADSTST
jgi:hypothetical protein